MLKPRSWRCLPVCVLVSLLVSVLSMPGHVPAAAAFSTSTGLTAQPNPLPMPAANPTIIAVATGSQHTCVLTTNGGVKCWGNNDFGQLGDGTTTSRAFPVDVMGLTSGVSAITAGYYHTCALTTNGGIKCWGNNYLGGLGDGTTTNRATPVDVTGLTSGVSAIAAGYAYTCARTVTGGAKCWGSNSKGQLGDGTTTNRTAPVDVIGLTSGVSTMAAGNDHTCALTTSGGAKCWGDNSFGQLGDGTTSQRITPVDVSGLASGVAGISVGGWHTCAWTMSGGAKCWGDNSSGRLGDGSYITPQTTPVDVVGLTSGVSAIAASTFHTCAVVAGGAKCWGDNSFGQLGVGSRISQRTPVAVVGLTDNASSIATSYRHTCAVTTSGKVKCWGDNTYGQLSGGGATYYTTPVDAGGLNGVNGIAASSVHTCAVTGNGGAKCWGDNTSGQLGDGTTTQRATPIDVTGLISGVNTIAASTYHTCALLNSGGVKCWGDNNTGELGDGTRTPSPTPVDVVNLSGVSAVTAGGLHTCARTVSGGVKCWGSNYFGQLGDGTTDYRTSPVDVTGLTSGVSAIAAGYHTCALTTSGGVKCWGDNSNGQLGDGTTTQRTTPVDVTGLTSGVSGIAAGYFHTCALMTTGGVKCWGDNSMGQLGDGTTTQRVTPVDVVGLTSGVSAIAAGGWHTCARTTSGGVKCWGVNGFGQLGDGTTTRRTTPVDVFGLTSGINTIVMGEQHTCASTNLGGIKCWGDNYYGQFGLGTLGYSPTPMDVVGLSAVPAVKGSLLFNPGRTASTSDPLFFIVSVNNPTDAANSYTVVMSLLQNGSILDSYTHPITVPAGLGAAIGFNFGTRPIGAYQIQAALWLDGARLVLQTADISVLSTGAQRVAEEYAEKLKLAARDEFDQMAGIPAEIIGKDITDWGWDKIESLFGKYFKDASAPVQEADPPSVSDANVNRGLQEGQKLLDKAGEQVRLQTAGRLREIIRQRTGVLLPDWFDPLNPDASLSGLSDTLKSQIKDIIAQETTKIVKEHFFKALFTAPEMNLIEARDVKFDNYLVEHSFTWTPALEQTFDRGRDAIRNTVESDAIITLGPVNVPGKTVRYDVTLLEQKNKFKEIGKLRGLIGQITQALTVVGVVIAVLIFIGAIASTGGLATAILPLIWKVIAFLSRVKTVLLPLALTFLTVTMAVSVPILAPRITAKHDSTLNEAQAIIGASGQSLALRGMPIASPHAGDPVRLQNVMENQSISETVNPVLETTIYSVDGRVVQIVWAQPTLGPQQSARLEKEITLPVGNYRAVSALHTSATMAVAVTSQTFAVSAPELRLGIALNKTVLGVGEAVHAAVFITNTDLVSSTEDLTLILEASDGQNFSAWPVSLAPGDSRQLDYAFVPPKAGSYLLRATLSKGLAVLDTQDAAYVVGSGPSLALDISRQDIYSSGSAVTLPITVTNAGDVAAVALVSVETLDRLRDSATIYSNTVTTTVNAGASMSAAATILPAALAQPGLYTTRVFVGDSLYNTADFAIAAQDTLFADIYPETVYNAVNDAVTLTVQVINSVYTYTDATVSVSLWRPDGMTQTVPMTQIGLGQYQGIATASITGTYLANVEIGHANERAVGNSTFFVAGERSQLSLAVEGQPVWGTVNLLTVTVRNERNVPIPDVSVLVSNTLESLSAQTDAAGLAMIQLAPTITESYQVKLNKMGFARTLTDWPVWLAQSNMPPLLFMDAPAFTNRTPITITGLAETGANLGINGQAVSVDVHGHFTATIALTVGANTLTAIATDATNNQMTVTRTITFDVTAPPITVTYPHNGCVAPFEAIHVTGSTEAGAYVVISDTVAVVDPSSGSFDAWILIQSGTNTIPIVATDAAGNTRTVTTTVTLATSQVYLPIILR